MWYNIESSFVCLFVCSRVVVSFVVQLPEVSEKQILTIEIQADWHFISFIFIFYFFFFIYLLRTKEHIKPLLVIIALYINYSSHKRIISKPKVTFLLYFIFRMTI